MVCVCIYAWVRMCLYIYACVYTPAFLSNNCSSITLSFWTAFLFKTLSPFEVTHSQCHLSDTDFQIWPQNIDTFSLQQVSVSCLLTSGSVLVTLVLVDGSMPGLGLRKRKLPFSMSCLTNKPGPPCCEWAWTPIVQKPQLSLLSEWCRK